SGNNIWNFTKKSVYSDYPHGFFCTIHGGRLYMSEQTIAGQKQILQSIPALSMEDERNHSLKVEPPVIPNAISPRPLIKITDSELRARVQWVHYTTPHFAISYDKIFLHSIEIETLSHVLE